jgi:hypothetical protein
LWAARSYWLARYNSGADRRISEAFRGKSVIAQRAAETSDSAAFADCAPLHLLSLASLDEGGTVIMPRPAPL